MDVIYYDKKNSFFPNWGWWIENRWQNKSWIIKVPLSMFLDGWHFCKFVFLASIAVAIFLLSGSWLLAIGYYIGQGIIHEILWKIK